MRRMDKLFGVADFSGLQDVGNAAKQMEDPAEMEKMEHAHRRV